MTNNDKIDKWTVLLSDQFWLDVDSGRMYKISIPKDKKHRRVKPSVSRLCVPLKFRFDLLSHIHKSGHFGRDKMYLLLYNNYYWKTMYSDIIDVIKSCSDCACARRNFAARSVPLCPLEVPTYPFQMIHLDHKNLPRPTSEGHVAILCIVCAFSGHITLEPVLDLSALTTAKVLLKRVITQYGLPTTIISDKGSAFTAVLFQELAKMLDIKHRFAATAAPRSNGLAERVVQMASNLIKVHCSDDTKISDALPLFEMYLNSACHTGLKISPYEILTGMKMRLAVPGNLELDNRLTSDQKEYYLWLKQRLADLHVAITENLVENKQEMKERYDKLHKVQSPSWYIGQKVLYRIDRIKPRSNVVLTHKPYSEPHFIVDIVQKDNIGPAYKLVSCQSGRPVKGLVAGDRLKIAAEDALSLRVRLPSQLQRKAEAEIVSVPNACQAQVQTQDKNNLPRSVGQTESSLADGVLQQQKRQPAFGLHDQPPPPPADQQLLHRPTHQLASSSKQASTQQQRRSDRIQQRQQRQLREQASDGKTVYSPAKRILRQRQSNGTFQYFVLFQDNSRQWCNQVTSALLSDFRLRQQRQRKQRIRR